MTMARDALRRVLAVSRDVQAAFLLLSFAAIVSWITLWFRPGLADWDIMSFYLPWYAHMGEQLRAFDIPGWNPYILSGTPFATDPQSGWGYLPAMALFTVFPPVLAFKLLIAFHFALSALGAYWLARLLRIGIAGSLVAGIVFAFSQNLGSATCCTIHIQLASWLPLALVGIELGLRQFRWERRLLAYSLTAFALSQTTAAWIGQGTYNAFLVVAAYVVWRCLFMRPTGGAHWFQRIRDAAVAGFWSFGLGLALGALALLPRLEAIDRTYVGSDDYRNAVYPENWGWSVPHLIRVLTHYDPTWYPFYTGGAMMAAALIGMTLIPRRPVLLYFAMLSVVVGILTIWPVRPTVIHRIFYLLPEYEGLHLHDPPRVLAVLPIGTALLAAAAIDRIDLVTATPSRAIGAVAILTGFLVSVLTNWGAERPFLSITLISVGILAGSIGILAIPSARMVLAPWATQAAMVIALIAMALDPAGYVLGTRLADNNNQAQTQAISITSDDSDAGGAGQFLRERAGAGDMSRYFGFVGPQGPAFQAHELFAEEWVMPLLINNRAMRLKLYDVQGYDPAQLQRYLATFTSLNGFSRDYHEALIYRQGVGSPLLDMLNVRYLILPSAEAPFPDDGGAVVLPPGYEPVFENRNVVVYENPDALPRAWVVHDARVADQSAALSLIAQELVDPSVTAVLETAPPSLAPLPDSDRDSVEFQTYQPDHVTMNVTTGSDGILVLADSFDPGWSVRVDGHKQTLFAVNGILRGVGLPAGSHQVEFVFQPASLRQGLLVTGVAGLVVVVLVGLVLFRPRRFGIADNAI